MSRFEMVNYFQSEQNKKKQNTKKTFNDKSLKIMTQLIDMKSSSL